MHDGDSELVTSHQLFKLFNSLLGVAIDESLVNIKIGVEIQENVHLPLLFLDCDVILVDTFKSEFLILNENLRWFSHKVLGHRKNFVR
jgi:hypothetical protein